MRFLLFRLAESVSVNGSRNSACRTALLTPLAGSRETWMGKAPRSLIQKSFCVLDSAAKRHGCMSGCENFGGEGWGAVVLRQRFAADIGRG